MSAPVVEDVALTAELDKLGPAPKDDAPVADAAPVKGRRKSRSGTSGAARARAAKAAAGGAAKAARPRTSSRAKPKIGEGMARMYAMAGIGVSMVPSGPAVAGPGAGSQSITGVVGMQLVAESESLGAAWEKAAADDPRIREALERLMAVSTVGQIVAAHLPVVMHGLVAAGMVPPAVVGHVEAPAAPAPSSDGQNTGGRP